MTLLGIAIAVNFSYKGKIDAEKYKDRETFIRMLVEENNNKLIKTNEAGRQ